MSDEQIISDFNDFDGYFTIGEVLKGNEGISGDYGDDILYMTRWLFDLENVGKIYRIRHNKEDYYITPENFQKIIREQNLSILLGLSPV